MVKTRGLEEAKVKLGDLEEIILNFLKKKKKVRIFESGCGYGKVMSQLKKKFGDKIEIIGLNFKPSHGDKKKVISFAIEEKIIAKDETRELQSIKIRSSDRVRLSAGRPRFRTRPVRQYCSTTPHCVFVFELSNVCRHPARHQSWH